VVVYDTYAWIEYFLDSSKGVKVKELLKKGGYAPSIVLAEISRKYLREGFSSQDVKKRLLFIGDKDQSRRDIRRNHVKNRGNISRAPPARKEN
jgi:predicted nucleic acid-binding protein